MSRTRPDWLAMALLCCEWDWSAAERPWERGLQLAPASAELRESYAMYLLASLGRFDGAIAEIERARELILRLGLDRSARLVAS